MNGHMKNIPVPQSTSPLIVWLYYLEHLHAKPIDLGLGRMRSVATELDLLRPAPRIVIVGGTNGKGTTCRLLEVIFLSAGMRVGVYSSPHLLSYTERVRIQGKELPEATHSVAMSVIAASCGKQSLSYFEFGTLAAFQLFKQSMLDIVILEVGLGGRLDATNIVDADIAVITTIALDHTDWLGPDRASIAREKAGIFRRGKPAVVGEPDRPEILDAAAADTGAELYARDRDWWWQVDGDRWCWWDRELKLSALPLPVIPLDNAATALAVIRRLPFSVPESAVFYGLRNAALPGRFQCIGQSPMTILDVAHNPHSAGYLMSRLATLSCTGTVRAVVGMLEDKDIAGTLYCLRNLVQVWYCASLDGPRAASAAQLAAYLDGDVQQFEDVESAWHQVMVDATAEDCVLVFGSFHTVALVMALTEQEKRCGK
ncbi:MAG: bifunctional folylpolyglutamate synthetase/dihydrofolate synthetase [Sodalis sp. Psp]|nr:bifunctional folylpolyglutamate synthetase/dihydrofolate synthetase [Sodalis sp. Psp]MCR3757068.1 bifunctional folylpolyglutamate synthetase/dihydrofolate synthetase [Sodalis sp. Ppy]